MGGLFGLMRWLTDLPWPILLAAASMTIAALTLTAAAVVSVVSRGREAPVNTSALTEAAVLDLVNHNVTQPLLQKINALGDNGTDIASRLSAIEKRMEALPRLQVIARGSPWARARFGNREIDVELTAVEYYERDVEEFQREKIHSKIAYHPVKSRWTRLDFIREVDEKARIRLDLDAFIGEGDGLLERAKGLVFAASLKPPEPPPDPEPGPARALVNLTMGPRPDVAAESLARSLQDVRSLTEAWEQRVYKFLLAETEGYAEEFYSGWPENQGEAENLRARLGTRVDRVRSIKARIG